MSNNILIKDGNNANVTLHTIEDATSVHFNQSIPTDIANNTATVVSGGQAVASGMGALVVAQRDALPAGTNLIGGVSVRGISDVSVSPNGLNLPVSVAGTITVGTHAVTQSGSWAITSINSRVGVSVENTNNIAVSLAPPTFNVPVSIANTLDVDVSVGTHPVTQSGTWTVQPGNTANTTPWLVSVNGTAAVSLAPPAYNLPVSVHPVTQSGTWNVGLNAGTNLVGAVSISPNGLNIPVSIAGVPNVNIAGAVVSNTGTAIITFGNSALYTVGFNYGWDGSNWRRVDVDSNGKANVSISNTLNIGVSVAPPTFNLPVSVHPVTQSGTWNVGLNAGTNHIGKVSVEGLSISGIGTQLVSVGGPVSVQGVQIVGRDGSGNARVPYVDASGIARVSIEGSLAVSGSSMTHTVGAAVTTEGYPMLGSDGTNSRRLLTTTGGALIVHVSNTAPGGGAGGSSMTQTVGAAVTTEGYPMLGSDGTNARIIRTDTLGRVSLADTFFNVGVNVALPAGTNLIGAVSISPNGLNLPVSAGSRGFPNSDGLGLGTADHLRVMNANYIYNSTTTNWDRWDGKVSVGNTNNIAVSLAPPSFNVPVSVHPVTQSGTWNVGLNAGTNLVGAVSISPNGLNIPVSVAGTITVGTHAVTQSGTWNVGAITSINSRVAVSVENTNNIAVSVAPPTFNLPVSVHPVTQSGTWNVGLNAGTNLVGAVSISPNGLNIPVSVANTINVNTHAVTQSGTWNIGALTSINSRVAVSVENTNNIAVSVANAITVGTHAVTQSGTWNIGALTSINSIVKVSIEGNLAVSGSSMTHTVGTAVTTEGYPMLGSDGTNSRRLLTTTGGALIVHVSNTAPGGASGGSTQLVSVGGPVSTQGVQVVGTDGTNARTLLTTTGGALVVHVSNTAPGGASGGGTPMVSVGGAVSTQAVQIAGKDDNGNARTIKTNVSGVTYISTRTFMSQDVFTRPADTTAYAAGATAAPGNAGDLIANSTTAGSVKPLKFRIARGPGQVAYIRGARMYRTGGTLATGQHNITGAIRLHLFNTNNKVSVANGDNGAFNASPVSNWMGYIDLIAIACAPGLRTSGAVSTQVYWGSPARTGEMIVNLSAAQVSIQGLLETRIAFTPINGEIFTVQIEGFNG